MTTIALAGDIMLGTRPPLSECTDEAFHAILEHVRSADLSIGHLETLLHDFVGDEIYPARDAGWTWMRSPIEAGSGLGWMGFDAVTLASNHALDWSIGGLRTTWRALGEFGIPHAGTGTTIDEAQAPMQLRSGDCRVAVVSMSSSYTPGQAAAAEIKNIPGRPGLNPLAYTYVVSPEDLDSLLGIWARLGLWVSQVGPDEWWVNPAGMHNTITRYRRSSDSLTSALDEFDVRRHLDNIARIRETCDILVLHIHNHEWDPTRGLSYPADFSVDFAHRAIDAGADIIFAQGGHAPVRGIEKYQGRAIIYDSGDFMIGGNDEIALPADFFDRHRHAITAELLEQDDAVIAAKSFGFPAYARPINPAGGYRTGGFPAGGSVVQCQFSDNMSLEQLTLTPYMARTSSDGYGGVPRLATGETADTVLGRFATLSADFGTKIDIKDDQGIITF